MSLLRYRFSRKKIGCVAALLVCAVVSSNVAAQNDAPPPAPGPNADRADAERADAGRADAGRLDDPAANRDGGRRSMPRAGNRRGRPGQNGVLEREGRLRQLMTSFGLTDPAVQDEVVRYIGEDVRARQELRRATQELYNAARDPAVNDERLGQLLAEYNAAVEADRVRRTRDEAALNERIKYKSNPRLETMLLMFGILGDRTMLIPMGPGMNRRVDRPVGGRGRFNPNEQNRQPGAQPERGETIGTLVTKAEDRIEIKPNNDGPNETYRLRRQAGVWDPAASRVIAELKEGDTVLIHWVLREGKRIIEIKKMTAPPEPQAAEAPQE